MDVEYAGSGAGSMGTSEPGSTLNCPFDEADIFMANEPMITLNGTL